MPTYQLKIQQPASEIPVHSQQSLLAQCQQAGMAVASSCRNGNCGRCFAQLLHGRVRSTRGADTAAPATIALCTSFAIENIELQQLTLDDAVAHWYCQVLSPQVLRLPAGQQPGLYAGNQLALFIEDTVIVSGIRQRSGRELRLTASLPDGTTSLAIAKIPARYRGTYTLYIASETADAAKPIWANITLTAATAALTVLQRHGGENKYILGNPDDLKHT